MYSFPSLPGFGGFRHLVAVALLSFAGFWLAGQAVAQSAFPSAVSSKAVTGAVRVDAVEVELVSAQNQVSAGGEILVGLRIRHDPHWHTYWRNPGDSGLPTTLQWQLPPGAKVSEIIWPAPKRLPIGPLTNFGYEDELVLPVRLTVAKEHQGPVSLRVQADWLMCKDVCIPGSAQLAVDIPLAASGSSTGPTRHMSLFEASLANAPIRPDQKLKVELGQLAQASDAVLVWKGPEAVQSAVFFPYKEGWLENAKGQVLHPIEPDGGYALRLPIAGGSTVASSGGADAEPRDLALRALSGKQQVDEPFGVMVINGQPFELLGRWGGTLTVVLGTALGSTQVPPGIGTVASASLTGEGLAALPLALVFAFVGGLILNLMPCVFPVLGLKVLTFAHQGTPGQSRRHALLFTAGVLVSFWVLALALIGLQTAGQAVGWGFQLQSPWFVAAMVLLFVGISLNLFGVFEMGGSVTRLGAVEHTLAQQGQSGRAAFASGVLAVLVATPCTAPFMGSALGFTLGKSAVVVFTVFSALGLGLALPYLLLGWMPKALGWLPKPGRWMESLRQALGFPMLATALWLLWVLEKQAGEDAVLALSMLALVLALLAWVYGRFAASGRRWVAMGLVLLLAGWLTSQFMTLTEQAEQAAPTAMESEGDWKVWSQQSVEQARQQGRVVLVDFTAAWCVSCQVNKKLVLQADSVKQVFAQREVILLRADWTRRDNAITSELARHGRNGVPLYLLYLPNQEQPTILPEILTPEIVLGALKPQAAKPSTVK